jgi:hypothetical protein
MIIPWNHVGARVLRNLGRLAPASQLMLICKGDSRLDPSLLNGKRVDFHVCDLSGSIGADVMIVDPTATAYSSLDDVQLFRKYETLKRKKHVLNGATMIPLVMPALANLALLLRVTCRV